LKQWSLINYLTLYFETISQDTNIAWFGGEPVHYDKESGMALLSVSAEGIDFVCRFSGE
jgi:sulfatase maturation enzyme AslB (radical SAM superfamily)